MLPQIEDRIIDRDENPHKANDEMSEGSSRTLSPTPSHGLLGSDTMSQNSDDDVHTQIDNMSVIGKMVLNNSSFF